MPKGVMVSHANVLANLGHIDDAFGIGRGDTIVRGSRHTTTWV